MRNNPPEERHDPPKERGWRVWLAVVAFVFIVGVVISGVDRSRQPLEWPKWTGFGEDKITKTSKERTNNNSKVTENSPITKITSTEEPQQGKTLWDWMELLLVPSLLALLTFQLQRIEAKRAEAERKKADDRAKAKEQEAEQHTSLERAQAEANQREDAMQAYHDRMSELLIDKGLLWSVDANDPARDLARIRTLTILRRLGDDGKRKGMILQFLHDTKLLKALNLKDADLRNVCLENTTLERAMLAGANLKQANLKGAILKGVILEDAILEDAILESANLEASFDKENNLSWRASLKGANIEGANLEGIILKDANLDDTKLKGANLNKSDLAEVKLAGADLRKAGNVLDILIG